MFFFVAKKKRFWFPKWNFNRRFLNGIQKIRQNRHVPGVFWLNLAHESSWTLTPLILLDKRPKNRSYDVCVSLQMLAAMDSRPQACMSLLILTLLHTPRTQWRWHNIAVTKVRLLKEQSLDKNQKAISVSESFRTWIQLVYFLTELKMWLPLTLLLAWLFTWHTHFVPETTECKNDVCLKSWFLTQVGRGLAHKHTSWHDLTLDWV